MISVCIATYNGGKYIKKQIESILNQISSEDEIIISDDNSTDDTINIIEEFNDKRIKLFRSNNKTGNNLKAHYKVSQNFERALKQVSGDYIILSDQDDIWYGDKIKTIIPYLIKGDLVMTNYSLINEDGQVIVKMNLKDYPISKYPLINCIRHPFHGCCLAFSKKILRDVMPFPRQLIMHDNWIGILAQLLGYNISFIEQPLLYYRRHSMNVSPYRSKNDLIYKILYRLKFIFQVYFRFILTKLSRYGLYHNIKEIK